MANNSTVTKVLQLSEEAAPAIHIPIFVGNEIFVLSQQDVRRIEDIRFLSYSRLGPNGELSPIGAVGNNVGTNQFSTLQDYFSNGQRLNYANSVSHDHGMGECPQRVVADIAKQLNWSKEGKCSSPYTMTYSVGTSTSEINQKKNYDGRLPKPSAKHCSCQTMTQTSSRGCNTEPTIKLPLKKQHFDDEFDCSRQPSLDLGMLENAILKQEPSNEEC